MVRIVAWIVLPLLAAGCAAPPRPRAFVHPESATDARLIEALDAVPEDKEPTLLERVVKTPLVVPTMAAAAIRDTPRALAVFAMTPVAVVGGLLEAVGLIERRRELPEPPPDPDP